MRSRSILVVLAGAVLVAAGCGHSTTNTASTTSTSTATGATAAAAPAAGTFGTLGQICGPGTAKGATGQGVTDTAIQIGTISDVAYPAAPGLFKEISDDATAFTQWCNAAGGIAGRKIKLDFYDAKGTQDAAMMLQACQNDFALVGDLEVGDAAGVSEREACNLPELPGGTVSDAASAAPLRVSTYPSAATSVDDAMLAGALNKFPQDTKIGYLYGNTPSVQNVKNRVQAGAKKLGFTTVYDQSFPASGIDNPQSYILQAKAAGVQVFQPGVQPAQLATLEQAMNTLGWYPDVIALASNVYDPAVIKDVGPALKSTWAEYTFRPFEAPSPALTQYQDIVKQQVSGGKTSAIGVRGFDAWLLFAVAAKACGSNLTRDCLLQQAGSQQSWTGGGIGAPQNLNPVGQTAPVCNVGMQATPTGWTVDPGFLAPTPGQAPFNCDARNVQKLP